jgi:peptide/nickel transport system substrate-binding protein
MSSDPTALTAVQLVNEYLFWVEGDSSLRPVLGLSSSVDSSGLVWTVALRKGVAFSDGTPFTADAVVSSFSRLIAPSSESPAAATFQGLVTKVTKRDDATVQFTLSQPFSDFPYLLSSGNRNTFILPPSYNGNWAKAPVGTGAFTLTTDVTNQQLTFARRANYWNARDIYLDAVDLLLYENGQSLLLAIESGEVDVEFGEVATDATSLDRSAVTVASVSSASFTSLALRVDKPPFNDSSVRQAVAWALDRPAINSVQSESDGALGNDHIFAPNDKIRPQGLVQRQKNLDKVKALLAGRTISFTITGSADEATYAAQLQQQLNAAGFKVGLSMLPYNTYYGGSNSTTPWLNAEATLTGWASRPTPTEFISYLYKAGAQWNASHYSNPVLDRLAGQYNAATSDAQKQGLVNQIAQVMWEDVPVILPLWEPSLLYIAKRVQGLDPNPNQFIDLTGVWVGG